MHMQMEEKKVAKHLLHAIYFSDKLQVFIFIFTKAQWLVIVYIIKREREHGAVAEAGPIAG